MGSHEEFTIRADPVCVRNLGLIDYEEALRDMRRFTRERNGRTADEIWVLQHPPVFTQGYSCSSLPNADLNIPVVAVDRGGQLTYHGPGQLIVYLMIDLKRRNQGVRGLVRLIESTIMSLLDTYGVQGIRQIDAPGVFVGGQKIASLGIRVTNGCSFHGFSLNVDMDTSPFRAIDVCGIEGLEVVTLRELGVDVGIEQLAKRCVKLLAEKFKYVPLDLD